MKTEPSKEEWKEIEDIEGYIGYFKGNDYICLDGHFNLDDLRRIITWLEKQIKAKS